jgi:hypothetical protein
VLGQDFRLAREPVDISEFVASAVVVQGLVPDGNRCLVSFPDVAALHGALEDEAGRVGADVLSGNEASAAASDGWVPEVQVGGSEVLEASDNGGASVTRLDTVGCGACG